MTADSRVQESVFAFLTDPARHPHVYRIDTHAASVFLEGAGALKIKRAVRFPYLDYSTVAKRNSTGVPSPLMLRDPSALCVIGTTRR
jgi:aminoglycoside phosphotransferase family enzyme